MTCKKLRTKARWEQDRWLSYLPSKSDPNIFEGTIVRRLPTDQERIDFLRFDSHGPTVAPIPDGNIIMAGKLAARAVGDSGWFPYVDVLVKLYFTPDWPGGLPLMEDYLRRVCGLGPLRKHFGDEKVQRWLATFLFYAFGWPDLVREKEYARFYRR